MSANTLPPKALKAYSSSIDDLNNGSQLAGERALSDGDDASDLDQLPPGCLDIDVRHFGEKTVRG